MMSPAVLPTSPPPTFHDRGADLMQVDWLGTLELAQTVDVDARKPRRIDLAGRPDPKNDTLGLSDPCFFYPTPSRGGQNDPPRRKSAGHNRFHAGGAPPAAAHFGIAHQAARPLALPMFEPIRGRGLAVGSFSRKGMERGRHPTPPPPPLAWATRRYSPRPHAGSGWRQRFGPIRQFTNSFGSSPLSDTVPALACAMLNLASCMAER